ncbi:D-alanine--D-alanine ligase family protein [Leucobacter chromiireducens]|uniref:D-alanine--D-alanine ligase family protein n=1 Tax=Leucobacter chromiireducens TaxID=283877 RepID=UPI000F63F63E|nr:D-alanine--D-alanine ligase [Leucobacter chromiireducens]
MPHPSTPASLRRPRDGRTRPQPARIAVIGGGANDEHSVSLASAAAVAGAVRELELTAVPLTIAADGSWRDEAGAPLPAHEVVQQLAACDAAFPVLHGVNGEDGTIAGFLQLCGVPDAGSPVRAGAIAMDKQATKRLAAELGIGVAPGVLAAARGAEPTDVLAGDGAGALTPPFVVKPASGGSSNGVFVVPDRAGLAAAVELARDFGEPVLVEQYVRGREIDIAVFRDRTGELRVGATLEIGVVPGGVFDRAEKYDGSAEFTVPAPLDEAEEAAVRRAAVRLYEALGCRGVARFDFFLADGGLVLNEVNTAPGMTEQSQVPRMYAARGLNYSGLIAELIAAALAR